MKKLLKALFFLIYLCAGARNAQALSVQQVKNWQALAFQNPSRPAEAIETVNQGRGVALKKSLERDIERAESSKNSSEEDIGREKQYLNQLNNWLSMQEKNKQSDFDGLKKEYSALQKEFSSLTSLDHVSPGLQWYIANEPIVAHTPQEEIAEINRRKELIVKAIPDMIVESKKQQQAATQELNRFCQKKYNAPQQFKGYYGDLMNNSKQEREKCLNDENTLTWAGLLQARAIEFLSRYYENQNQEAQQTLFKINQQKSKIQEKENAMHQEQINLGKFRRRLSTLEGRPWQSDDPD